MKVDDTRSPHPSSPRKRGEGTLPLPPGRETVDAVGQCAGDLVPVYRAYNNGNIRGIDSNHRITSNLASYQAQIAKGWKGEGVVMCAPAS